MQFYSFTCYLIFFSMQEHSIMSFVFVVWIQLRNKAILTRAKIAENSNILSCEHSAVKSLYISIEYTATAVPMYWWS